MSFKKPLVLLAVLISSAAVFAEANFTPDFNFLQVELERLNTSLINNESYIYGTPDIPVDNPVNPTLSAGSEDNDANEVTSVQQEENVPHQGASDRTNTYLCDDEVCYLE